MYPALICKLPPVRRVQKAWERRDVGVRLRGDRTEVVSKGQQPGAVISRVSWRARRTQAEQPARSRPRVRGIPQLPRVLVKWITCVTTHGIKLHLELKLQFG